MSVVNITKRSNGWQYRFEGAAVDGKRKQFSKSGFRTKKEALDAGTKALNEYNQCGVQLRISEMSVTDYLKEFITSGMADYKETTVKTYRTTIEHKIIPMIGHYKLSSITPKILSELLISFKVKNYSSSTITIIRSVLTSAFNYAVYPMCYLQSNPMLYVKTPRVENREEKRKPLNDEEWKKIIEMFPDGNRHHLPLMVGYYCGLRISECYGLLWSDIDFEKNTINVQRQLTLTSRYEFTLPKQSSTRVIKFGETLRAELLKEKERQEKNREYYGEYWCRTGIKDGWIRSSYNLGECDEEVSPVIVDENGRMLYAKTFIFCTKKIKKELGIDFDYHTLRHTHATKLIESGVNVKAIQMRLGHKNIKTTLNVYTHVTESMDDEAVTLFEKSVHA